MAVCGLTGEYPVCPRRRNVDVFIRHLAVVVFQATTDLGGDELAHAAGFSSHGMCLTSKPGIPAIPRSAMGLAMRDEVIEWMLKPGKLPTTVASHADRRMAEAKLKMRIRDMRESR